jgi:hypothetical protein
MRARQLIAASSYAPDVVGAMFKAFDAAWDQIKANVGTDALAIDRARVDLANVILALARDGERDIQKLTNDAIAAMAHKP